MGLKNIKTYTCILNAWRSGHFHGCPRWSIAILFWWQFAVDVYREGKLDLRFKDTTLVVLGWLMNNGLQRTSRAWSSGFSWKIVGGFSGFLVHWSFSIEEYEHEIVELLFGTNALCVTGISTCPIVGNRSSDKKNSTWQDLGMGCRRKHILRSFSPRVSIL